MPLITTEDRMENFLESLNVSVEHIHSWGDNPVRRVNDKIVLVGLFPTDPWTIFAFLRLRPGARLRHEDEIVAFFNRSNAELKFHVAAGRGPAGDPILFWGCTPAIGLGDCLSDRSGFGFFHDGSRPEGVTTPYLAFWGEPRNDYPIPIFF